MHRKNIKIGGRASNQRANDRSVGKAAADNSANDCSFAFINSFPSAARHVAISGSPLFAALSGSFQAAAWRSLPLFHRPFDQPFSLGPLRSLVGRGCCCPCRRRRPTMISLCPSPLWVYESAILLTDQAHLLQSSMEFISFIGQPWRFIRWRSI